MPVSNNWTVSELWIYPIKSCKGIPLQRASVGVDGLEHDRQFMIVDAHTGMFAAQRGEGALGIPIRSLCQIAPAILESAQGGPCIELSAPGMENIRFSPPSTEAAARSRRVQVWEWKGEALVADDSVNDWLTEFLNRERRGEYQLVMGPAGSVRRSKMGYSRVRFADAYPFLVISQESVDDLNRRIDGEPLPMNRFRPSIVISGGQPYDEDRLHRMVIHDVDFEGKELCVRCPITTTDQETAVRGKEPLRTLATYRRHPYIHGGVVFGRNFNHLSLGEVSVDDQVVATLYGDAVGFE